MSYALVILTPELPELIGTFIDLAGCMEHAVAEKINGGVCVSLDVLDRLNEPGGIGK